MGRRSINPGSKKVGICVTLSPEIVDILRKSGNVSEMVEFVLSQHFSTMANLEETRERVRREYKKRIKEELIREFVREIIKVVESELEVDTQTQAHA